MGGGGGPGRRHARQADRADRRRGGHVPARRKGLRVDALDLLVIGGGMAGLTAAAAAASAGARVLVAEKGEHLGGSAIYAGYAWTAPSTDVLREQNPDGDPALGARLVADFPRGVEWIRTLGVECRPAVPVLGFGRGHQFDTNHYLAA